MRQYSLCLALLAFVTSASLVVAVFTSNLTVIILDCDGSELIYGNFKPLLKLEGDGYSIARECNHCNFNLNVETNSSTLKFNLTIKWMGVTVYRGALTIENKSSTSLQLKVNVSRVKLIAVDDDSKAVANCKLEIGGPVSLSIEC
ncbi:MAG TPA: hypothetical protein ENG30_01815, partial [Thermofilaceae archaeon]|nr:hypothetical protein [Thermofilaceae archaeon]